MQKVTAIFDIGKTNKKFFLFDINFKEVFREYEQFEEIQDEDGYPTVNLAALKGWIKSRFHQILKSKVYKIIAVNFSSYGASLVHLNHDGEPITPLYNYTKKLPESILTSFNEKYGSKQDFSKVTRSENFGMLNSGMQLYWLKYAQPELFKDIKYSLHLPQYLSYLMTGIPVSKYTSIGCHTSLWNYKKHDYHHWVKKKLIASKLPPIVSAKTTKFINYEGNCLKIGVGINDSSSALIPHLESVKKPFILVLTGTWSVSINPFSDSLLSSKHIKSVCINYMLIDGKPVRASRIYLGDMYKHYIKKINSYFNKSANYHRSMKFNFNSFEKVSQNFKPFFNLKKRINDDNRSFTDIEQLPFDSFEIAYHQFMLEIVQIQVESIKIALGKSTIKRLYIDGGFGANHVYTQLLAHFLRDMRIRTTNASLGSALGAALVISDVQLNSNFLKQNFNMKKQVTLITI